MKSIYTPSPVSATVQRVKTYGPRTVIEFEESYPWAVYTLLLSQSNIGVSFEGLIYNGMTMWNNSPVPLFRTDVNPGQSWNTPLGTVALLSKTATINGGGRQFNGVYQYRFLGSGETWSFQPDFGVVQYSVAGVDFNWASGTSYPSFTPVLDQTARVCPLPGLTSIPESATLNDTEREAILRRATDAGSKNLVVSASWAELEPSRGTYNLTRISKDLQLASKYGLSTVFTLRVPQAAGTGLPPYLNGLPLNDSTLLNRLDALWNRIAPLLNSSVKWVNVGYEMDTYLSINPQQLTPFQSMFDRAKSKVKALKPGMSVGMVFNFDLTRGLDTVFRSLYSRADHIAYSYYAITGDFQQRDVDAPAFDIPLMVSMANGKPMLLVELGYSSSWAGTNAQAQFLGNALNALRKTGGSVSMFSIWSYRDIPSTEVATLSMQYGQTSSAFSTFITSLGLKDQYETPKPAYSTFLTGIPVFSTVTPSCTAN